MLLFCSIWLSCKKEEPLTKPVTFNTTTYEALGTYDTAGKPDYLLPPDNISSQLLSFLKTTLPDQTNLPQARPDLFHSAAIADLKITQPSDVFITFLSQGANLTNTFAFYAYPTNQPPATTEDIKKITYVFPNSGKGTPLKQGDKVSLGHFESGNSIGFVLLQMSWNPVAKTIDTKVVHFCSHDWLNPEVNPALKRHAVLIEYKAENKTLIGFEDKDRTLETCDNDFNDVVFYYTVKHNP
jgi:hypothetical protein